MAETSHPAPRDKAEDPAITEEDGVRTVNVRDLIGDPEDGPGRPSTDTAGTEGGTAGTTDNRVQDDLAM